MNGKKLWNGNMQPKIAQRETAEEKENMYMIISEL